MCNNCGSNPCNCNQTYSYNWYNTEGYPCNPCSTTEVCKKKIPAKCTIYKGPALNGIGLTTDLNIELILATISAVINQNNTSQATKNTNILSALNDINDRLNILESGSHAAYTI